MSYVLTSRKRQENFDELDDAPRSSFIGITSKLERFRLNLTIFFILVNVYSFFMVFNNSWFDCKADSCFSRDWRFIDLKIKNLETGKFSQPKLGQTQLPVKVEWPRLPFDQLSFACFSFSSTEGRLCWKTVESVRKIGVAVSLSESSESESKVIFGLGIF